MSSSRNRLWQEMWSLIFLRGRFASVTHRMWRHFNQNVQIKAITWKTQGLLTHLIGWKLILSKLDVCFGCLFSCCEAVLNVCVCVCVACSSDQPQFYLHQNSITVHSQCHLCSLHRCSNSLYTLHHSCPLSSFAWKLL